LHTDSDFVYHDGRGATLVWLSERLSVLRRDAPMEKNSTISIVNAAKAVLGK
jgi:hypothetical protein